MGYREKLSPEKELAILAGVKTKVSAVQGTGAVFDEPVYFSSKQDFVDELQTRDPQFVEDEKFEIRATIIEWLGYEDIENFGSGGAQCPDFVLNYSFHLFQAYQERESSSSYKDFKAAAIRLRNKFLMSFKFPGIDHVEHKALVQTADIATDLDSRFFPGILGTYMDFSLRVEVTA